MTHGTQAPERVEILDAQNKRLISTCWRARSSLARLTATHLPTCLCLACQDREELTLLLAQVSPCATARVTDVEMDSIWNTREVQEESR